MKSARLSNEYTFWVTKIFAPLRQIGCEPKLWFVNNHTTELDKPSARIVSAHTVAEQDLCEIGDAMLALSKDATRKAVVPAFSARQVRMSSSRG